MKILALFKAFCKNYSVNKSLPITQNHVQKILLYYTREDFCWAASFASSSSIDHSSSRSKTSLGLGKTLVKMLRSISLSKENFLFLKKRFTGSTRIFYLRFFGSLRRNFGGSFLFSVFRSGRYGISGIFPRISASNRFLDKNWTTWLVNYRVADEILIWRSAEIKEENFQKKIALNLFELISGEESYKFSSDDKSFREKASLREKKEPERFRLNQWLIDCAIHQIQRVRTKSKRLDSTDCSKS